MKTKLTSNLDKYVDELIITRVVPAVTETQEKVVNGKIKKVQETIDSIVEIQKVQGATLEGIKKHLTDQDGNLEDLSKKIKPFNDTKNWFWELGKVILGVGALCAAIYYGVLLSQVLHIIR